jgi:hypothetical protein
MKPTHDHNPATPAVPKREPQMIVTLRVDQVKEALKLGNKDEVADFFRDAYGVKAAFQRHTWLEVTSDVDGLCRIVNNLHSVSGFIGMLEANFPCGETEMTASGFRRCIEENATISADWQVWIHVYPYDA